MARSTKTTASKSRGGIKARGRAAKKTSEARKKKPATSRKTVSKTAAARKRTSAKTTASKFRASVGGGKARGRTAASTASRATKTASKRANSSRKRSTRKSASRATKTAASKRANVSRKRSTAKSASRATKTASKRENVSRKRSTTKSVSNRSGVQRTRRAENATLGAAITNPVTEAMALGTELVSGAIQAGGEIAAAAADMAMSAARTAAAVTTGVVPDVSQDEAGSDRGGGGKTLSRPPSCGRRRAHQRDPVTRGLEPRVRPLRLSSSPVACGTRAVAIKPNVVVARPRKEGILANGKVRPMARDGEPVGEGQETGVKDLSQIVGSLAPPRFIADHRVGGFRDAGKSEPLEAHHCAPQDRDVLTRICGRPYRLRCGPAGVGGAR